MENIILELVCHHLNEKIGKKKKRIHNRPSCYKEQMKRRLPLLFLVVLGSRVRIQSTQFSHFQLFIQKSPNSPASLLGKWKREQSLLRYLPKSSRNCGCKHKTGGPQVNGEWSKNSEVLVNQSSLFPHYLQDNTLQPELPMEFLYHRKVFKPTLLLSNEFWANTTCNFWESLNYFNGAIIYNNGYTAYSPEMPLA